MQDNEHFFVQRGSKKVTRRVLEGFVFAAVILAVVILGCDRPWRSVPKGTESEKTIKQEVTIPLQYYALVIGINEYNSRSIHGWETLKTARSDAEEIADVLQQDYGFSVRRLMDSEASREAIISALDQLLDLTPNDAAIVYFAGHGFYDKPLDEGYWIPADARKRVNQRYAKEDWIWNAMITKMVNASPARHILVIADACFSGSLFKGELTEDGRANVHWYQRALAKPSRYLITSGDMEPVLDTGGTHSVFAKELLNFLEYTDRGVFSASELGLAIREKVSALTGQMVRMGPLATSSDAGGELVFVRKGSRLFGDDTNILAQTSAHDLRESSYALDRSVQRSAEQQVQDALLMHQQGATNSAQRIIRSVLSEKADDSLVRAVSSFLNMQQKSGEMDTLAKLIERIEAKKKETNEVVKIPSDTSAKVRVMACLGPVSSVGNADDDARALLYRICIASKLQELGAVQVVEREALQEVMQELNLSVSDFSDPQAQTMIGKFLPAGFLLLGDVISQEGNEIVYLRLVDTETSKLVGSFSEEMAPKASLSEVCERLARKISTQAAKVKPLTARVFDVNEARFRAAVGRFHGATNGMVFSIITRLDKGSQSSSSSGVSTLARVSSLGETESELSVESKNSLEGVSVDQLWVQEVTP